MDSAKKQNQIQGIKTRLGKSFGKFSKAGSLWHWTFQWANNMQKQDGYDSGMIETNYDVFQRLKLRFFDGVLLNKHNKGQNYSELIAGGNVFLRTNPYAEHNREDILMFSFTITWENDMISGKKYRKVRFTLNEDACRACKFTVGQVKYINELFGNYELQVKSQYGIVESSKTNVLAMLAAAVPTKNVETTPQTTQQPQTQHTVNKETHSYTTGKPQNVNNILGTILGNAPKVSNDTNQTGKALFSQFIKHLNVINLEFCLQMVQYVEFVSYDGTVLTLFVHKKTLYEEIESIYFDDFSGLIRNVFGKNVKVNFKLKPQN